MPNSLKYMISAITPVALIGFAFGLPGLAIYEALYNPKFLAFVQRLMSH